MTTESQKLRDQARRMRECAERADRSQDRRRELAIAESIDKEADALEGVGPKGPASCVHCQGPANTIRRFMPERHLVLVHHRRGCPVAKVWKSTDASEPTVGGYVEQLVMEHCESPDRTRTLEWWKLTNVKYKGHEITSIAFDESDPDELSGKAAARNHKIQQSDGRD